MTDHIYGSLERHHLHLRTFTPLSMRNWTDDGWRFSWSLAANPVNWWLAAKYRESWRLSIACHRNTNWRCYCPVGFAVRCSIALAGFGVVGWYHWFGAEVPCVCDRAMEEWNE